MCVETGDKRYLVMTSSQGGEKKGEWARYSVIERTPVDNRKSDDPNRSAFSPCLTFVLFDKRLARAHGMISSATHDLPRDRVSFSACEYRRRCGRCGYSSQVRHWHEVIRKD